MAAGRSRATVERAVPFSASPTLAELLAKVDAVISVCPPHAAAEQAQAVAAQAFAGLYIDANAVAPATAERIADLFGDRYVDGGIVGPPALEAGTTRLYLSGQAADTVSTWFAGTRLDARVVSTDISAASALKMAYAAYTKGSSALLLAVNALAGKTGVADALRDEWEISQPALPGRSEAAARGTSRKAWRFAGEMEEIAATFAAAGLPDGFHQAAAQLYERMAPLKDLPPGELADVVNALLQAEASDKP